MLHRLLAMLLLVPLLAACGVPGRGSSHAAGEIYSAAADGSGLTRLTRDSGPDLFPKWSPDGTRIVFVGGDGDVFVMQADGSGRTRLASTDEPDAFPVWSPEGSRVAFVSVTGGPDGAYILHVVGADGSGLRRLMTASFTGASLQPGCDARPAWSPDGALLVYCRGTALYTIAVDGGAPIRLTNPGTATAGLAAWSPEGSRIAFVAGGRAGSLGVFAVNADGSDLIQLTDLVANVNAAPAWSPDGTAVLVSGFVSKSGVGPDIWAVAADGSGGASLTRCAGGYPHQPVWSPDGRRIAFVLADDSEADIFTMMADGSNQQRGPSTDWREANLAWSPDGTRIAFETNSDDESSGN